MTSSYAALNVRQRAQRVLPDGTIELVATEQGFLAAARLFTALGCAGFGEGNTSTLRPSPGSQSRRLSIFYTINTTFIGFDCDTTVTCQFYGCGQMPCSNS